MWMIYDIYRGFYMEDMHGTKYSEISKQSAVHNGFSHQCLKIALCE